MRRLAIAVVVAAMTILSSCGRQVTGLNSPNQGLVPKGQMQIQFQTAAPIDLQDFTYLIVLNTSGNGQQPYAQGLNSNFNNWSYVFVLGGGTSFFGGTQYATAPSLIQIYQNPTNGAPGYFRVTIPQNQMVYEPTIPSGTASGFEVTFNRCILDLPSPVATASPSPNPAASPTPVPTTCPPGSFDLGNVWNISLFTLDTTSSVVSSLSSTGPTNADYTYSVNALTLNGNSQKTVPANSNETQNLSAQITGIDVLNTP